MFLKTEWFLKKGIDSGFRPGFFKGLVLRSIRVRPGLGRSGIYILIGVPVALVGAFGSWRRGFFDLVVIVVLEAGVEAIGFGEALGSIEAEGLIGQGL